MAQDPAEIWQEMMTNWQAGQKTVADQMLNNFKQWNSTFAANPSTDTNSVFGAWQAFTRSFWEHFSHPENSGFGDHRETFPGGTPAAESLVDNIKKLMRDGQQLLDKVTADFAESVQDDASQQYLLKALLDMSNPNRWLKYSGDTFDAGAHKLSEGPLFSGINDIDQRMARVSDSWRELFERSKEYHAIVFNRWSQAYSRFINDLKNLQEGEKADLSPRKLVELWSGIANDELLELHRSEEFLESQRAVIRASMQYRVHEKNMAEVICDALHIPNRSEIDDLYQTVTELRRELRQTKAALKQLTKTSAKTPRRKSVSKKSAPKKSVAKKPSAKSSAQKTSVRQTPVRQTPVQETKAAVVPTDSGHATISAGENTP